jgi:hypothetical protein
MDPLRSQPLQLRGTANATPMSEEQEGSEMVYVPEPKRRFLKAGLSRIAKRAERNDDEALRTTFVELADLSIRLLNDENQVLFGRRGTGKTHALVHLHQAIQAKRTTAVLVDLRTIGSAGGYYLAASDGVSLAALRIIVDLLSEIHGELFRTSIRLMEEQDVTQLVRGMDQLAEAVSALSIDGTTLQGAELTETVSGDARGRVTGSVQPHISLSWGTSQSETRSSARSESGIERPSLNFSSVAKAFNEILPALPDGRLWILLDEWSALPFDVQPIVADFIRRCLLPCRGLVLKVAAVEQRSRFWDSSPNGYVGLELGADIFAGVDLDDYLAVGLKRRHADLKFYETLVLNHLVSVSNYADVRDLNSSEFSEVFPGFRAAVYFSAGIPRDLLSIVGLAAMRSSSSDDVQFHDVALAARQFFIHEKEKQARWTPRTRALSTTLRDFVEAGHQRFLVDRDHSHSNAELLELLDQRIIHLLDRGVGPRGKYDVFAVDLGMIADELSEESFLPNRKNPWVNWDHVKTSQKFAPVLSQDDGRIRWHSPDS